jgi:hypothetical protein
MYERERMRLLAHELLNSRGENENDKFRKCDKSSA